MKITVIIPTYNYAFLLANAIDSVLSQTRKADLVMVVDDASQDQVLAKIVADRYNIPFVGREKNMGHHKNFQDILENILKPSKTDAACFITADNWLHQDYLLETEKLMEKGFDIVGTQTFIVGEYADLVFKERGGDWLDKQADMKVWKWSKSNIMENCWLHGSSLFRVSKAIESLGFGDEITGGPDWNLWKNMIHVGANFDKVEKPLFFYRQHRLNYYQHTYDTARKKICVT